MISSRIVANRHGGEIEFESVPGDTRFKVRLPIQQADAAKLKKIEVELDQCWDLLRQRQARRAAGQDPSQAHVRPAKIVENYEQ